MIGPLYYEKARSAGTKRPDQDLLIARNSTASITSNREKPLRDGVKLGAVLLSRGEDIVRIAR
jgi:hypothetical protein